MEPVFIDFDPTYMLLEGARSGLKRSNAKLRKRGLQIDPRSKIAATSSPDLLKVPSESVTTSRLAKTRPPNLQTGGLNRSARPHTSSSVRPDTGASCSRFHIPFQPKPELKSGVQATTQEHVLDQAKKRSMLSSFARKVKAGVTRSKKDPPDNFTRWDERTIIGRYGLAVHPSNIGRIDRSSDAESLSETGITFTSDPFDDAALTQHIWSRRQAEDSFNDPMAAEDWMSERSVSAVDFEFDIPSAVHIDWDRLTVKQTDALIKQFDSAVLDRASPGDTGVGLEHDGGIPSYSGKGKSRELGTYNTNEPSRGLAVDENEIDGILARELAFAIDMKNHKQKMGLTYQEWADRIRAIALHKLERSDQRFRAQEDRRRAEQLQQQDERLMAELACPRTCVCCSDTKHPLDFPARPATTQCNHPSRTCSDCMHEWLASEFSSKGCEDIHCAECPSSLSYDDMKRLASEATFIAYEKLLTRTALSALPEFAWCLSPTCNSGQLNISDSDTTENYMDCVSCGYKQCLHHRVEWHKGETCTQYDYRTSGQKARDDEAATAAMLDTVSKACPGAKCGWRIQKIDGCDHMTCKKCKHEFCWECLASHKEIKKVGNTAHESWCKFHSDNLKVAWPFNMH